VSCNQATRPDSDGGALGRYRWSDDDADIGHIAVIFHTTRDSGERTALLYGCRLQKGSIFKIRSDQEKRHYDPEGSVSDPDFHSSASLFI
jgi:hypothetical protein